MKKVIASMLAAMLLLGMAACVPKAVEESIPEVVTSVEPKSASEPETSEVSEPVSTEEPVSAEEPVSVEEPVEGTALLTKEQMEAVRALPYVVELTEYPYDRTERLAQYNAEDPQKARIASFLSYCALPQKSYNTPAEIDDNWYLRATGIGYTPAMLYPTTEGNFWYRANHTAYNIEHQEILDVLKEHTGPYSVFWLSKQVHDTINTMFAEPVTYDIEGEGGLEYLPDAGIFLPTAMEGGSNLIPVILGEITENDDSYSVDVVFFSSTFSTFLVGGENTDIPEDADLVALAQDTPYVHHITLKKDESDVLTFYAHIIPEE